MSTFELVTGVLVEVICTMTSHLFLSFPLQVVVAAETGGALGGMVRQLSIDQFENEGRRVSYGTPENATAARKLLDRQMSINSVPKKVLPIGLIYAHTMKH